MKCCGAYKIDRDAPWYQPKKRAVQGPRNVEVTFGYEPEPSHLEEETPYEAWHLDFQAALQSDSIPQPQNTEGGMGYWNEHASTQDLDQAHYVGGPHVALVPQTMAQRAGTQANHGSPHHGSQSPNLSKLVPLQAKTKAHMESQDRAHFQTATYVSQEPTGKADMELPERFGLQRDPTILNELHSALELCQSCQNTMLQVKTDLETEVARLQRYEELRKMSTQEWDHAEPSPSVACQDGRRSHAH